MFSAFSNGVHNRKQKKQHVPLPTGLVIFFLVLSLVCLFSKHWTPKFEFKHHQKTAKRGHKRGNQAKHTPVFTQPFIPKPTWNIRICLRSPETMQSLNGLLARKAHHLRYVLSVPTSKTSDVCLEQTLSEYQTCLESPQSKQTTAASV